LGSVTATLFKRGDEMVKIKRQGIFRVCSKRDYERKFKSLGFEIVEDDAEVEKTQTREPDVIDESIIDEQLEQLTNEGLRDMLRDQGKPIYGKKSELINRLKGGE
jgi:hypothetical protein